MKSKASKSIKREPTGKRNSETRGILKHIYEIGKGTKPPTDWACVTFRVKK